MHLIIEFSSKEPIRLPLPYNHILQGFIYSTMDDELAEFLHGQGYGTGRKFKVFACSNIMGKAKAEKGYIQFGKKITIEISSPVIELCESFANGLFKKQLKLGQNEVEVSSIKIDKHEVNGNSIKVKTLSPIVAYSTMLRPDGSKYTCYFHPDESDFKRIASENLRKKYTAFTKTEAPKEDIDIKPLDKPKLSVINYKNTIIKGYSGIFELTGPRELLQMAIDAGLGSKNSQCFGLIRLYDFASHN